MNEIDELKQQIEFHLQILNSVQQSVIVTDKNAKIILWNDFAEKLYGYTQTEAIGKTTIELISPVELIKESHEKVEEISSGKSLISDYLVKNKAGKTFPVSLKLSPIFNNKNEVIAIVGISEDISEKKEMENQLIASKEKTEENEQRYRALITNLNSGVVVHLPDTSIIHCNLRASELLGLSEDQMKGKVAIDPQWKFIYSDNSTIPLDDYPVMRIINSKKTIQNQVLGVCRASSNIVWLIVNGFPVFNHSGELTEIDISFIDITELRNSELLLKEKNEEYATLIEEYKTQNENLQKEKEKVKESELKFKNYFDNAPYGVFIANEKGDYLETNHAASLITGYSESELCKMNLMELIPDSYKSNAIEHFENVSITGSGSGELQFQRKDKTFGFWIVNAVKLSDTRFLGFVKDITDRKQADLLLKEKNEEIEAQNEEYLQINEELNQANQELIAAKEKIEESEIKYKAAFYTSPDSVNINKLNGEYVEINEGFTRLIGYTKEECIGKLSSEIKIWSKSEDRTKLIKGLNEFGIVENLESVFLTKDGTLIPALMSARIIKLNNEPHILSVTREISERKKFENELLAAKEKIEESEQKYKALYVNAPLSYQSLDENGCFIDVNPMWLRTLGYDRNEVIGSWYGDFLHPDYVEHFRINFQDFKKQGYISDVQFKLRKKDGTFIYVSFEGCIGYTPEGKFKQTYCTFKDITEQKAIEQTSQRNQTLLKEAEILTGLGCWDWDITKELAYWSDGLFNIFKRNPKEGAPYRRKHSEFYVKEDFELYTKAIDECKKNGTPYQIELRVICSDGEIRHCISRGKAERNADNVINRLWGTLQDITEQKALENELIKAKENAEENEQRLKLATISGQLGIWDWNVKDNIMIWDKRMFELYGINNDTFPNNIKAWTNGLHPDDKQKAIEEVNAALNGEINFNTTFRVIHPDGTILHIKADGVVMRDSDNKPLRMIGINKDITKNKIAEEELIKAKEKAEESDRLKTQFLLNMSHEVRTPMNSINGFSDMLNKPDLSDEKRKKFTSIIINSSNQLQSIIENILTISALESKLEKATIQPVNINSVINELLAIFRAKTFNNNFSLYSKQELNDLQSEIYSDKTKITQILTNLLTNALKFTHEGYVELGYNLKNNEIEFYLKDTGIGIKPDLQEKIFERFIQVETGLTRQYGGNGLGLSISKGFVELLGGKIWVNSELEKGSTFYFTIPYKPVNEIKQTNSEIKQKSNLTTVLVAEDEEYNFLYIEELLINMDFKLIHAKNGKEAVEISKTNSDINVILMDIKMPILDGHEAAKQIKKLRPGLTIIAQSAYTLQQYLEKYNENLFDDYISKPLKEEELKQKLMKYINIKKE